MNFNTLVENYLVDLEEGRMQKSDKFSNFEIDTQTLNDKLENGSFDVIITAWSNHSKYGNITTEQLKNVIREVSNNVEEYGISTYEDLKSTVENITDNVYENKGIKRKTLVDRLTKAVINLIFHKEYDLVNLNVTPVRQDSEDELTGLTEVENAVVDYIEHSEEPVTLDVLNRNFSGADSIVDTLTQKGIVVVNQNGVITLVNKAFEGELRDGEDPLEADEDVRTSFFKTMGRNNEDDFDLDRAYQDPDSVSSVRRWADSGRR
jgi:hypothetical protein